MEIKQWQHENWKNKTKEATANKVFQIKEKLWIIVYLEQSRMTFHFCPPNQGKRISGSLDFKVFRGSMPLDPPSDGAFGTISSGPVAWIPPINTSCNYIPAY